MTSSIAITPALSNTLRGAEQYWITITLKGSPFSSSFPNKETVDISGILRETLQQKGGSKLYTFSVSDFFIKHDPTFNEAQREPLALQCQQLTRGRTPFLTPILSDQGSALSGASSAVLQELPNTLTFELGKFNLQNAADSTIYNPNGLLPEYYEPGPPPSTTATASQLISSVYVRFSLTVQYLTETL